MAAALRVFEEGDVRKKLRKEKRSLCIIKLERLSSSLWAVGHVEISYFL